MVVKLMIVEPEAGGHHMILHVRLIARAALRRGWELQLLTTQEATQHSAYKIVCDECGQSLRTLIMPRVIFPANTPSAMRLLKYQFGLHAALRSAYRDLHLGDRPDIVYLINLDGVDKAIALIGSPFERTPFDGLHMGVRFHHRTMGVITPQKRNDRINEVLFRRLLRTASLKSLVTIDESLFDYMGQRSWASRKKVRYVPDATTLANDALTYEQARYSLGIRSDQIVVLVFGAISLRKGIEQLLRAIADPHCSASVIVLLAGQQEPVVRDILARPEYQELLASRRIIEMPGFLNDEQEYFAFRVADVAWLGYHGFYGMSGVLVSAASLGIPVIACQEGVLGWMARKYRLGEIVDVSNEAGVIEAINELATNKDLRLRYGKNGLTISGRHSGKRFGEAICNLVEEDSSV